mgnify:CR=1 FL=1
MNKYLADELFKRAYGHLQKKEFGKSSQLFEKLLKDYPDNLSILRNLSHSYAFSGNFQKAEECIKKILKIYIVSLIIGSYTWWDSEILFWAVGWKLQTWVPGWASESSVQIQF